MFQTILKGRFLLRSGLRFGFSVRSLATASLQGFKLRPYQQECIESCVSALEKGKRRIAVSLPTGAGKTVIFTNLINSVKPLQGYGHKTMILVHRKELAFQAADACKRANPDKVVELEMGEYKATEDADIIVASVQTLIRGRFEKFRPEDFKMLVVDECHHAAADSYLKVFDYFDIKDKDSKVALVGFSATLAREDTRSLDSAFDDIVYHLSLEHLIYDKHLVDAKFTTVTLKNADLDKVKTARGDFVLKGLSNAINNEENSKVVLGTYLHFVQNHNVKSTMLFGVDINHVETLCSFFQDNGVKAEFVTSKTKKDIRAQRIADFKAGRISVLMNCGIFTEGTDMPNIDCILLARPTKSKTLLVQMIGRGLRLHESKDFCHIVDFVGVNNTGVITVPTLRGLPVGFESNELSFKEMDDCKAELEEQSNQIEAKKEAMELEKKKEEFLQLQAGLNHNLTAEYAKSIEEVELQSMTGFEEYFNNFVNASRIPDGVIISGSKYPWVRGPTNYIHVLKISNDSHLRLQIHPQGLKDFLKEVETSGVYFDTSYLKKIENKVYTLSLYTENASFKTRRHFYEKRWNAVLLHPVSANIHQLLSFIDKRSMALFGGFRDKTKFTQWRSTEPSTKQKALFDKLAQKLLPENELSELNYKTSFDPLTKGEVSDVLFGHEIFRVVGFKSALNGILKSHKWPNLKWSQSNKEKEIEPEFSEDVNEKREIPLNM